MVTDASRHAREMDASSFWRQFPATVAFVEPVTVEGTVESLNEIRVRDEYLPKLRIRQDDGVVVIVTAGQARLLAELVRLKPAVGDRITIRYLGEAGKAAPGMNRTKEFDVEVKRAGKRGDPVARTIARAAGDLEGRLSRLDPDRAETIKHFRRSRGLTKPLATLSDDDRRLIAAEIDRIEREPQPEKTAEEPPDEQDDDPGLFGEEPF